MHSVSEIIGALNAPSPVNPVAVPGAGLGIGAFNQPSPVNPIVMPGGSSVRTDARRAGRVTAAVRGAAVEKIRNETETSRSREKLKQNLCHHFFYCFPVRPAAVPTRKSKNFRNQIENKVRRDRERN